MIKKKVFEEVEVPVPGEVGELQISEVAEVAEVAEIPEEEIPQLTGGAEDVWEDEESGNVLEDATADSPFFQFTPEAAEVAGLKVLVYGASGSGKTHFAGTFPRPLFLDLEGGMRPVAGMGVLRWPAPGASVSSITQVKTFWQLVKAALKEKEMHGVDPGFDTIVIDGLNELQDLVMRNVIDTFPARRQYEDQPVQADYGKANRDLLTMVRLFLKFPCHVVFTCNEVYQEADLEGKYGPKLVGRAATPEIMRLVDMVGRCYTYRETQDGPVIHGLIFEDSPTQYGKDRIGMRDPVVANSFDAMAAQL